MLLFCVIPANDTQESMFPYGIVPKLGTDRPVQTVGTLIG